MSPRVSIILPCFNRQHTLRASVLSVLTQSYADFELIVVDDGSHEDIKAVLDAVADPRLHYVRRARNGGAAAARNTGIAAARGEFIAFQDSDDIWLPGKLERQLALFDALAPDYGIVTSHRIIYGRDAQYRFGAERVCVAPALSVWPRGADQLGAMLDNNRLSLPCALFRRDVMPDSAWFDPCARANEDWEFAVRVSQRTRIYEDDRPVMLSYISGDSISSSRRKQALGTIRVLRKNRAVLLRYPRQRAAILLDIARTLAATGKPRWARRFIIESMRIHPSAAGLLGQGMLRKGAKLFEPRGRSSGSAKGRASAPSRTGAPASAAVYAPGLSTRAALYAQRHAHLVPPVVRDVGRRLLGRSLPSAELPVTDWAHPLVGARALGAPPASETIAPPAPARTAPGNDQPALRCLIVTGVLDVGGTDEVAAFLARRLPAYGIATLVAHTGSKVGNNVGGRLPALLRQEGIRVEDVDAAGAAALLRETRPDIISAHCPPPWWVEIAARANVPFVETLHGMHDLFGADWQEEARRASKKACLIAVSELVRQQYLQGNPAFPPDRIITVPNSLDSGRVPLVDRVRARQWLGLDREFLFISLARHALQKNGYALVDAFGEVAERHPEAHLLIAGRPDNSAYMTQLGQLRARLPGRERIHLRDHASWTGALLAAADAFVMNSYFEGWSLATMEALGSGLPVLASDVGGAREQIGTDSRRGMVIANPLGDPLAVDWRSIGASLYLSQANRAELVGAMERLIAQRARYADNRARLRAESLERFAPHHALEGHVQVLRKWALSTVSGNLSVVSEDG